MAKDYSKKMKQSALIQQTEEYMDNEVFGNSEQPEQGRAEASVPQGSAVDNQQMQTTAQPAAITQQRPLVQSTGLPVFRDVNSYNEVLKNIGGKIPLSIHARLTKIKSRTESSGIKTDKLNIGDLIAQAVIEFVEKYDVQ